MDSMVICINISVIDNVNKYELWQVESVIRLVFAINSAHLKIYFILTG